MVIDKSKSHLAVSKELFKKLQSLYAVGNKTFVDEISVYGAGLQIIETPLLPIKIPFPACDLITKKEIEVIEEIHAFVVPPLDLGIPPLRMDVEPERINAFDKYILK